MNYLKSLITATALSATLLASAGATSIKDFPEIDRYISGAASPRYLPARQYTADGTGYLAMSADGKRIVKYDSRTGKEVETVMDLSNTRGTTLGHIAGFKVSPEGSKVMVWNEKKMIYRRSFTAKYYIYEMRTRELRPLSEEHPVQQSPVFSPNGRMVAFVADNDIYVKKLDYWSEVRVTTDGAKNSIINGIPDWVYEEEFTTTCSMAWSPDDLTLCFLKYNEKEVPQFAFPLYEGPACDKKEQYALYPGEFKYKYPVAGQKNSVVTLHSYDVETRKIKDIKLPGSQIEYIPRIAYGDSPEHLMAVTLNRDQTRMEIYSVNPRSTTSRSVLVEQWKAWLDPSAYEDITWLPNSFVVFSCRSGYNHLYEYTYAGSLKRQITSGNYDVTAYYGCNAAGTHFYQSTASGAVNRIVSSIDVKGKVVDLSPREGTSSAQFSPAKDLYVLNYSNVTSAPKYTLHATQGNKQLSVLLDNSEYQSRWASAPKPELFTMTTPEGLQLNGYVIKPEGFDASRRYPVIMYQYQGPGSQEVLNRWHIGYENYFAKAGFVVVCVDGRGTGGRGREFMDAVYKRLGHFESIDQIAAANYAAKLPYVDPQKIAIFGWSYGGYETIMACSQPDAPYAAAVAVAPVTDWRYYDTVYAERYMLTPQQNEDGYKEASTMTYINNRRCPLLIMHGTADDNVHFFNSVQYASAAESQGRWLDMLLFPNMDHSINACGARKVVIARLIDYLRRNLAVK